MTQACRGADDHGMPRAAQEQFLGGGIECDAARIAGREREFPHQPLRQRVNDRDGTTRILLVGRHGQVELVRLGIEDGGFNSTTRIGEDQLAHDGALGNVDEGGKGDSFRAVGHEQELILWIVSHFIGPFRAAGMQCGDDGARGEVDDLDRAVAIGGPELAEVVHQHAAGAWVSRLP